MRVEGDTEDGLGRSENDVGDPHDTTSFEDVVRRQDIGVEDEMVGLEYKSEQIWTDAENLETDSPLWRAQGERRGG